MKGSCYPLVVLLFICMSHHVKSQFRDACTAYNELHTYGDMVCQECTALLAEVAMKDHLKDKDGVMHDRVPVKDADGKTIYVGATVSQVAATSRCKWCPATQKCGTMAKECPGKWESVCSEAELSAGKPRIVTVEKSNLHALDSRRECQGECVAPGETSICSPSNELTEKGYPPAIKRTMFPSGPTAGATLSFLETAESVIPVGADPFSLAPRSQGVAMRLMEYRKKENDPRANVVQKKIQCADIVPKDSKLNYKVVGVYTQEEWIECKLILCEKSAVTKAVSMTSGEEGVGETPIDDIEDRTNE